MIVKYRVSLCLYTYVFNFMFVYLINLFLELNRSLGNGELILDGKEKGSSNKLVKKYCQKYSVNIRHKLKKNFCL